MMNIAIKFLISFVSVALISSCAGAPKTLDTDYFQDKKGCFLLFNMKTKSFEKVIGGGTCNTAFPACSTFKVPLAVMAFDSGVLKDENATLKWDGVKESREALNKDHDAKSWIKDSVVWYSQRVTKQIGKKKLQNYLNAFNYGNKDISAGIDDAWLLAPNEIGPGLEITPLEQVEFMEKLWTNSLPASDRSMELTRKITYLETSPKGYELHGKTGSNFYDRERKVHLGWFISHLKKGNQEYIAVTNISDLRPFDGEGFGGPRAKALTKKILEDNGLW